MVFAGTMSIVLIEKNDRLAKLEVGPFDADGENLIDILRLYLEEFYKIGIRRNLVPRTITWWTITTHAGAVTDIVSIKLMASIRAASTALARWIELGEITDADEDNGGSSPEDSQDVTEAAFPTQVLTQFDVDCITVGDGNSITLHAIIGFGEV